MDRGESNRFIPAALVSFSVEDVQEAVGNHPHLLERFVQIANRKRREESLRCEPIHRDLDDLDGKDLSVKDLFAPAPAPYHRDLGTKPLPAERSALLHERREYDTYVKNYETDVWDMEMGGCDEDYYGCRERLTAINAALALLVPVFALSDRPAKIARSSPTENDDETGAC